MILTRRHVWTLQDVHNVVLIVLYVNLVPYISRVSRGIAWVAQYSRDSWIPDDGLFWWFIIQSFPAVPVIVAFRFRRRFPVTFIVSMVYVTAHLYYWHHDLDLPMDALASGFTLLTISVRTFVYTAIVTAIAMVAELAIAFVTDAIRRSLMNRRG